MNERATRGTQERIFRYADGRTQARVWTAEVEAHLVVEARELVASGRCALLALGSLGRRELCFGSDLDLTLLTTGDQGDASAPHGVSAAAFTAFQHRLLDEGLRLQVTLRTVDLSLAAVEADLRAALNLWEGRVIAGDPELARELLAAVAARVVGRADVVEALQKSTRARWARFGDTVYRTEPNLKLGKGGLRDAQTLGWIRRILGYGALEPRLAARFERSVGALFRLRNALTLETGDRIGALVLPAQRRVALRLGLTGSSKVRPETHLLRHQFEIARTIAELLELVFEQVEEGGGPALGERRRFLAPDAAPLADPFAWIHLAAHSGGRIPHRVRAALTSRVGELSPDALVGPSLALLLDPTTAGDELGLLEKLDVLPRIAPEWARIAFLPRGDAHHLYTVDRHSFMAVRLVKRLLTGEPLLPGAVPVQLASPHREALILAALFHDVGKGDEGSEPHEVVGARLTRGLLERWGVSPRVVELAEMLVQRHLELSRAAQSVDPRNPVELIRLARTLGSADELAALYALTLADASAVKQEPPSRWFVDLVTSAYLTALRLLDLQDDDAFGELAAEVRAEVLAQVGGRPELGALVADLPDAFFARGQPVDLVARLEVARAAEAADPSAGPGVAVRVTPVSTGSASLYTLDVAAADRPGLLSRITWAIALHNLNLLEASLTATRKGLALDHFVVEDRYARLGAGAAALSELASDLDAAIRKGPSRALPVPPRLRAGVAPLEVRVEPGPSGRDTVVEIGGEDRPGVAHRLADLLFRHGLSITGGRIATLEGRVRDVFHVERVDGGPVTDREELERLRAEIRGMFG